MPDQPTVPGPGEQPARPPTPAPTPDVPVQQTWPGAAPVVTEERPRRKGRVALAAGGAALAVLVGGGTVWAVSALSGGGTQPEDLVPANALAFVDIDLDPAAGQKIDAARFLRRFPDLSDKVSEDGDPFEQLVRAAIAGDPQAELDYDRDVAPWVGRRAGVAVLPPPAGDDEPEVLGVVQVTDEDAARTSLRRILDEAQDAAGDAIGSGDLGGGLTVEPGAGPAGLVVRDGYALVGKDQATTERLSKAAEDADLGSSKTYGDDLGKVGDRGVATLWVDVESVAELAKKAVQESGAPIDVQTDPGRLVGAVRLKPSRAEVVVRVVDSDDVAAGEDEAGALAAGLPKGTVAALALGGMDEAVDRLWRAVVGEGDSAMSQMLSQGVYEELGVRLPDELKTLLGQALVVSVHHLPQTGDWYVGVREKNVAPDAAEALVDRLLARARQEGALPSDLAALTTRVVDDGLVVATDPRYAAQLAAPSDGTLGDDELFQEAVPDAADADSVLWLDLRALASAAPAGLDDSDDLGPLAAIGGRTTVEGGELSAEVRLVLR